MTIAAILNGKGRDIVRVTPTAHVSEVVARLAEHRIGAVLVIEGGAPRFNARSAHILGIVSERDIVRSLARDGAATLGMTAAQLMTSALVTVTPVTTVEEAMALMSANRVRHLPVLLDGALAGLVSIGDIVKTRLEQQAHEVDSLRAYVSGGV